MAHSFIAAYAHFVFSTVDRMPLLPAEPDRLHDFIGGIIRGEDCSLISIGGMNDHIHLLIRVHPSRSYADLMRVVKARSSAWLKESGLAPATFGWQSGYGAFSVSKSVVEDVAKYIEHQAEHHHRMTFKEEFIALLERHGVEYDPRYVWG